MRVEVNGTRLYFDVEGLGLIAEGPVLTERPTLIVLHGAPGLSDHTSYKPEFSQLANLAQVVYLDLAGCGRSDNPADGAFSLESWADDLVAFCEALDIRKPIVFGNSAGGMVASLYAILHPSHPAKLILSSTHAKLNPERTAAWFERAAGFPAAEAAMTFLTEPWSPANLDAYTNLCVPHYNQLPPGSGHRHGIIRPKALEAFHGRDGIWRAMDHVDRMSEINCPTLVMAGELDPITTLIDADEMVANMTPGIARYERLPDTGHSVWRDSPQQAFALLREFIDS